MADESDVETALVTLAAGALYPLGTGAASVTGAVVRVYRGWPANAALEADIAAGIAHVSVTGIAGSATPVPQFPAVWEYPDPVTPALTVGVQPNTVTFAGTGTPGQLAGILADDTGFAYRTNPGDTPELVAASLCSLINQVRFATVNGASVTVLGTTRLIGRVVADQTALMQTRRQRADFKLTCWCGDPLSRDATAAAIDARCAQTYFLALADGSVGRLIYQRSESEDDLSTLPLYRRELIYSVEYATTLVQTQPSMLFGILSNDAVAGHPVLTLS
jgi:hypothetical protein